MVLNLLGGSKIRMFSYHMPGNPILSEAAELSETCVWFPQNVQFQGEIQGENTGEISLQPVVGPLPKTVFCLLTTMPKFELKSRSLRKFVWAQLRKLDVANSSSDRTVGFRYVGRVLALVMNSEMFCFMLWWELMSKSSWITRRQIPKRELLRVA